MTPTLCIYHGNCADGFGAAWAVRKKFGPDVVFHAGFYGDPPPDVRGHRVLIVDFSYPEQDLIDMGDDAGGVAVLDHHKSAQAALSKFPSFDGSATSAAETLTHAPVVVHFDMAHSGAALAWRYCFPGHSLPTLLQHVQDRDLWTFDLPRTREIQACVFSHPYDFDVWDQLADIAEKTPGWLSLVQQGEAIERKHHKDIAELIVAARRSMIIGGVEVPVANLPYTMSSDAAGTMAKDAPFAACYLDTPKGRNFSLRSRGEGGMDVSEVAKKYGGGGHRNAAGFSMPIGWEGDPPVAAED